jgi:hypothetical protein
LRQGDGSGKEETNKKEPMNPNISNRHDPLLEDESGSAEQILFPAMVGVEIPSAGIAACYRHGTASASVCLFHCYPAKSRTESTGCRYRLSRYRSPYSEMP